MTDAIDTHDRDIIAATQAGLPLMATPYAEVARQTGLSEEDVLARIKRLMQLGVIRRIGIVPNHYALGLKHNAMTVWDVADDQVSLLGPQIGALPFVTHCYRRPRHLPQWPYNLFAMVHGRSAAEVADKTETIAQMLAGACRAHDVLMSTRILKKTGMRIKARNTDASPATTAGDPSPEPPARPTDTQRKAV